MPPVNGGDLYAKGAPLTESQFRELYATFQADLDRLPPPPGRSESDMELQYAAEDGFRFLRGHFPGVPGVWKMSIRHAELVCELQPVCDGHGRREGGSVGQFHGVETPHVGRSVH